MQNDRDNKYEGQDDSEYHFSDDEVSYEVDPEPSKQPSSSGPAKESIMVRLSQSRRMVISVVVFLVLVFVVYKMVAPTSSTPTTDIAPPVVATQNPAMTTAPTQAATTPAATAPVNNMAQTAPLNSSPPVAQAQAEPVATQAAPMTQPEQTMQQPMVQQQAQQQQQVQQQQQPITQSPPMQQPQQSAPIATLPAVIPVESTVPYNVNQPAGTPANNQATPLSAESERLMSQMQAEYAQRLNDYAAQNKNLQDQMQVLNQRVVNMEAQLNQLVQVLTRHRSATAGSAGVMPSQHQTRVEAAPQQSHEAKVAYSVQAIIPGRAWLRSDNGETVTVAEGDSIKDLGRVTKIDPYDGVVEVNTGTKVISLSYGNGG